MSDIDWSKAPEGATHYSTAGTFLKEINGKFAFFTCGVSHGGWLIDNHHQPDRINLTPRPIKPVYTQAMKDKGIHVKAGMMFTTEVDGNYTAELVNDKSVCFTDEDGFLIALNIHMAKPIDTRTDTEKAIDDLRKMDESICNDTEWHKNFIEAIKSGKVHGITFTGES
jgi:hypothetical protein